MKYRLALIACLALFCVTPAWADGIAARAEADTGEQQQPNTGITFVKNRHGGALYLMLGNNTLDVNELNSRLAANGYSTFNNNFTMLGVGGHAVMDDWVVGAEFHWMNQKRAGSGAYNVYLNGYYMLVNAGYVIRRADSYLIYPQAGVGFGGMTLNIQSTGTPTFDQVLANPARGSMMNANNLVFNVGLAADGFAPLTGSGSVHMPFTFGFRAGYLFSSPLGGWQSTEGNIAGGPSPAFTGVYVQVIVGLGFFNG